MAVDEAQYTWLCCMQKNVQRKFNNKLYFIILKCLKSSNLEQIVCIADIE